MAAKEMKGRATAPVILFPEEPKVGKKSNIHAGSALVNPPAETTAGDCTARTARMIQPVMAMTNCTASVMETPQSPERPE